MIYSKIIDEDIKQIIEYCTPELLLEKLKDKTVLITGASGMIGSYFVYTFVKLNEIFNANIKIKALIKNEKKFDDKLKNQLIEVIVQDVTEKINIEGPIDYIVHAASPASPKIMKEHPVETNFANTLGTANTLKLALEKQASGFLFISSREIYGEPAFGQEEFTEDGPLGQVNPLVPRNGYAEGKKAAENMCCAFKEQFGINTKIVRLAHTYGPGMSIYDGRVQADFLNNIMHNENIVLKSDGSSIRTYTYIADAIKAMILVLLKSKHIVYNIADENSKVSIKELAEILLNIKKHENLKLVFNITKEENKGCASFNRGILSTKKIREELNWNPKYGIKEGFRRTIQHLEEEMLLK